jgi:hypothetical protein
MGEVQDMDEDGPNDSPYEMLAKHDQSETKRDTLPHSVLVVDNAAIHKVAGIRELVEGHSMRLLYLPAYSPDFNPIELVFSSIKAWLRANRARINAELDTDKGSVYHAIWEAVYSVTMDDAKGWYSHSGYYQVPP